MPTCRRGLLVGVACICRSLMFLGPGKHQAWPACKPGLRAGLACAQASGVACVQACVLAQEFSFYGLPLLLSFLNGDRFLQHGTTTSRRQNYYLYCSGAVVRSSRGQHTQVVVKSAVFRQHRQARVGCACFILRSKRRGEDGRLNAQRYQAI